LGYLHYVRINEVRIMTYQVLARKWRPQKFQDVVGQDHITRSLQNAIATSKVGHAYIFAGTRGVGKTSLARIFAKSLRCEKRDKDGNACHQCPPCLDFNTSSSLNVIEIDGASNNSVENVRELISNAQYLPTTGTYKIYIIDEVHMLSTSAFNALLKTLEEPPAHVVFVLATTAPEKLLETVLSRCQRFDFRHVSMPALEALIKKIAIVEKISFADEKYIRLLCHQGKGSVRDTLSLLDQVLVFAYQNQITEETLSLSLGLARISAVRDLVFALLENQPIRVSQSFRGLISENVAVKNILSAVLEYLFEVVESKINVTPTMALQKDFPPTIKSLGVDETIWCYEILAQDTNWILSSIDPEKTAEIVFQKLALRNTFLKGSSSNSGVNNRVTGKTDNSTTNKNPVGLQPPEIPCDNGVSDDQAFITEENNEPAPVESMPEAEQVSIKVAEKTWDDFLKYLNTKTPALTSNLEQGNLISPVVRNHGKLFIHLGLGPAEKVFWEYLLDVDIRKKLLSYLKDFYQEREENIELKIGLLDEAQKKALNFRSVAEQHQQRTKEKDKNRQQNIENNPLILQAAQIFNSKIDKVILHEER
jgi:DNA polymerase III subunit gamma/tau